MSACEFLQLLQTKKYILRPKKLSVHNTGTCIQSCTCSTHILVAGLKVNDQLVAYAARFSVVRLKNHVWLHHCALKAKVQCDFSAYSPDHINNSD